MGKEKGSFIELTEKRAMLFLPKDAIELNMKVTIYRDGTIENVTRTITNTEIQKAFIDAEENYIEPDDEFCITDKGKDLLKLK